jgi:hypothetical protein
MSAAGSPIFDGVAAELGQRGRSMTAEIWFEEGGLKAGRGHRREAGRHHCSRLQARWRWLQGKMEA